MKLRCVKVIRPGSRAFRTFDITALRFLARKAMRGWRRVGKIGVALKNIVEETPELMLILMCPVLSFQAW